MRMRRHGAHEESSHSGIDLAPMLDFVLNLLIFFIITAVFVKEMGISVNRPGGASESKKESGSITVLVGPGGEVILDDRAIDIRAVRANITRLHAQKPDYGVNVIAHKNAETGAVVAVVDQIRQGGVENVSFSSTR
jgi:biopolymer transport protein ExbD